MNAPASVSFPKPSMERTFRRVLSDPRMRSEVQAAMGWDDSQISRFLSGQMGITIDKVDAAIGALGMVITTKRYMDFLSYGSQIGTACVCARAGAGECGAPI